MHALVPFVAEVWSTRLAPGQRHLVVPDGCMDLVFRDGSDAELFWVGPMTHAEIVAVDAPARFLGVRFRPGVAPAFMGLDARELLDRDVPANDARLLDALIDSRRPGRRGRLLRPIALVPRGGLLRPHTRVSGALTDSYKTGPRSPAMLACMKRISPGIIVKDTEAAKAFYTRHLAAKVIFDAGWYVALRLGGQDGPEVSFAMPHHDQDTPVLPGTLSLYVEVDDVDAVHEEVRATGAVLEGPPSDKPWGDRSFTLTDPHGVRVYVFSPRPMSPEFEMCVKE